jgi:hypothetical protein
MKKKKLKLKKRLTCERRVDFSTANISKVQQQALLQHIENVLARYLLWGRHRNGGMMAMTRCQVGCRGDRDEFDKEPAVLVYREYSLVSITVERQD